MKIAERYKRAYWTPIKPFWTGVGTAIAAENVLAGIGHWSYPNLWIGLGLTLVLLNEVFIRWYNHRKPVELGVINVGKYGRKVALGREMWEDALSWNLSLGYIELLPGIKFEDCWELNRQGVQFSRRRPWSHSS